MKSIIEAIGDKDEVTARLARARYLTWTASRDGQPASAARDLLVEARQAPRPGLGSTPGLAAGRAGRGLVEDLSGNQGRRAGAISRRSTLANAARRSRPAPSSCSSAGAATIRPTRSSGKCSAATARSRNRGSTGSPPRSRCDSRTPARALEYADQGRRDQHGQSRRLLWRGRLLWAAGKSAQAEPDLRAAVATAGDAEASDAWANLVDYLAANGSSNPGRGGHRASPPQAPRAGQDAGPGPMLRDPQSERQGPRPVPGGRDGRAGRSGDPPRGRERRPRRRRIRRRQGLPPQARGPRGGIARRRRPGQTDPEHPARGQRRPSPGPGIAQDDGTGRKRPALSAARRTNRSRTSGPKAQVLALRGGRRNRRAALDALYDDHRPGAGHAGRSFPDRPDPREGRRLAQSPRPDAAPAGRLRRFARIPRVPRPGPAASRRAPGGPGPGSRNSRSSPPRPCKPPS